MSNGHACCILGVCCPPGGAAQRQAFQTWLTEKIQGSHFSTVSGSERETGETVAGWLDELPWKGEESENLADPSGTVA